MIIKHARGALAVEHCLVMGIVNRTPDSFYDGGRMELGDALDHAMRLEAAGADLLDVGAVKAGPGARVDEEEETMRLLPLLEALARRCSVPISVETSRSAVAQRSIAAGASIVNDVTELSDQDLAGSVAAAGAALVLMHAGGQIRGRPRNPRYDDVVAVVLQTWEALAKRARAAGIDDRQLIFDPGLDFGKTTYHSLELMRRLDELVDYGRPVLVAPSMKDVVGETLGLGPVDRSEGTLALVALAARAGVAVVRVHDVDATVKVVRMVEAVCGRRPPVAAVRGLWE